MQGAEPTKRQLQILEIVKRWIRQDGIAPTYADIAKELGIENRSVIQRQMKSLEQRGLVEITGLSRGIRLLREGTPILDAKHLAAMKADDALTSSKHARTTRSSPGALNAFLNSRLAMIAHPLLEKSWPLC